jgi:hypothetical protein
MKVSVHKVSKLNVIDHPVSNLLLKNVILACACNVPTEIVINEDNYGLLLCATYGCDVSLNYNYCYPSNCTWKVVFFHFIFENLHI